MSRTAVPWKRHSYTAHPGLSPACQPNTQLHTYCDGNENAANAKLPFVQCTCECHADTK